MNLLAFDTSTETLSVAVQRTDGAILRVDGPGGAKSSTTLIPAVLQLLADSCLTLTQLDAIVFGRGPGSFTGLRTACSVAQGLAFGSGVPVLGVDTLLAVAQQARSLAGVDRVVALLDARMDEIYCAAYAFENGAWREHEPARLLRPEQVLVPAGWALAGNAFAAYGARLPAALARIDAWPTAQALLLTAPDLIAAGKTTDAAHAMPLYIRDKVAQTTEERAAARAIRDNPT
ncbi:MAG: tRNA (adenosine(37)-N6)-threonylcarbamoyltransferase complex dimerization subunit type 1 TsaB [Pseudomonadota bacterium]